MSTTYCYSTSPIGKLLLTCENGCLTALHFANTATTLDVPDHWRQDDAPFTEALKQLDEYFTGRRQTFTLAIRPQGTAFQQSVWRQLQQVPYGQTTSYGEIARQIGNPKACRAVGLANGKNPLPIIIPCHRIIGRDGSLTGFGGGLEVKKQLLDLEQANRDDQG